MKVTFDKVFGQKLPKSLLQKAIIKDEIAPVYLFVGPEGIGKATLAVEFVKAAFCRNKNIRPCNTCNVCRRVGIFVHPDFWILLPSKITGDERELKKYWNLREKMGKDGWIRPRDFDKTQSISHHLVKLIQEEMGKHPYEAEKRFVLILDADLLTVVAQNNLLKALEENPTNTHFILVTSRLQMILPTIRSRSQIIPFSPLNFEDFSRYPFPDIDLDVLYHLSDGSIGKAREMLDSEWILRREKIVNFVKDGSPEIFSKLFISMRGDRRDMVMFLKIFGAIIKDIFQIKLGLSHFVVNVDLKNSLKDAAQNVKFSTLEKILQGIRKGEEGLRSQVNPDLLLSSLLSLAVRENYEPSVSDWE